MQMKNNLYISDLKIPINFEQEYYTQKVEGKHSFD